MHRPPGMAYQQARTKDTRNGHLATGTARDAMEGKQGEGGGQEAASPPPSQSAMSAADPPTRLCPRRGSGGALRHTAASLLGSLRFSKWGSHW